MKLLLPLAGLLLLSGCMPSVPTRTDGLAMMGRSTRAPRLRHARLAIVFTENTRNAAAYLKGASQSITGRSNYVNDEQFFRTLTETLERTFKEVSIVQDAAEAKETGSHLVGLLDVYAKVGTISFTLSNVEIAMAFQSPDGQFLTKVAGAGRARVPYPALPGHWPRASEAALNSFSMALSTNTELAEFAKTVPEPQSAPVAVGAAPAAPASPVYSSDVESPSYKRSEDQNRFALIVGVQKYQGLPDADHAARDAAAVKAHLLAAGYPERNIVLLTDQQALRTGLEKYVEAWLPRNTNENSRVLFYFSGHGAPDPESNQAYLMPWDGDPKFLETTGYPVKRLYAKLNALPAKQVLVLMDSCFSGVGGRSVIAKGTRPLVAKVDEGRAEIGRAAALTASAADEVTGTNAAAGHGLFTYHFLKALQEMSGRASFQELFDALSPKVRDAARRDNRDQTPQLIGDASASL